MNKLSSKKGVTFLALLCSGVYFISYISRINLAAVLVEVVASGFAPQTPAALALTACSITYGAGQLVSGYLGDKYKPQSIIFAGFLLTGAMNLSVGLLQNSAFLVALWAVNGFAQSLMWPPLVKIMVHHLSTEDYEKACVKVSYDGNLGSIAVYLAAPLLINAFTFRGVFLVSGSLALAMAFLWKWLYGRHFSFRADPVAQTKTAAPEAAEKFTPVALVLLALIMTAVVLQGALRDGVANWMPTYISDVFSLGSDISILSGAVLPVFGILSIAAANLLYRKLLRNELVCAGAIFGVGCAAALLLLAFHGKAPIASVLALALLSGSMHGVNVILICMIPPYFAKFGRTAFVSGALNSCTYVGAAISTYGIALLTQGSGWNGTVLVWAIIAAAGSILCLVLVRSWRAFRSK